MVRHPFFSPNNLPRPSYVVDLRHLFGFQAQRLGDVALDQAVMQVVEMFPGARRDAVRADLLATRSIALTTENILQHRDLFVDAAVGKPSHVSLCLRSKALNAI